MPLMTKNRIRVAVSGAWAGCEFHQVSGLGGSHNTVRMRTVAGGPKRPLSADPEKTSITVVGIVDTATYGPAIERLLADDPFAGTTITVMWIGEDGVVLRTLTYPGCSLESYQLPDGDANATGDGAAAELTLVWSVQD